MNREGQNPVILTEEDYQLLKSLAAGTSDNNGQMSLAYELSRAVVVKKEDFPEGTIRLNSEVEVLDMDTQKAKRFTIVMPAQADIKEQKISVLTPMGSALIGFKKDDEVVWKVPAGLKRFKIVQVTNA